MNFNELINPQAGVVTNSAMQAPQMDAYQAALGVNTPPPVQVPMAQMQAPIAPTASQMPPEELQRRTAGWQSFLDEIQKPEVMGPLSTFVQTLMSPPRPGEHPVARVLRAQQLMQTHKQMLAENARKRPMGLETEQLAFREAKAKVGAAEETLSENRESRPNRIALTKQQLENAKLTGDVNRVKLSQENLDLAIKREFGRLQEQLNAEKDRAAITAQKAATAQGWARIKNDERRADRAEQKADAVLARQKEAAKNTVFGTIKMFQQITPLAEQSVPKFWQWVSENSPDPQAFAAAYGSVMQDTKSDPLAAPFKNGLTAPNGQIVRPWKH